MAIIDFENGYFMEVHSRNYTLKRKYKGKTKDGNERFATKVIGHYGDLLNVIKAYLNQRQLCVMEGEILNFESYVRRIEESNKDAVFAIARMLRTKETKEVQVERKRKAKPDYQ